MFHPREIVGVNIFMTVNSCARSAGLSWLQLCEQLCQKCTAFLVTIVWTAVPEARGFLGYNCVNSCARSARLSWLQLCEQLCQKRAAFLVTIVWTAVPKARGFLGYNCVNSCAKSALLSWLQLWLILINCEIIQLVCDANFFILVFPFWSLSRICKIRQMLKIPVVSKEASLVSPYAACERLSVMQWPAPVG